MNLKDIFRKHGLDPMDMFLLNEADWPQEAKEFCKANPLPKREPVQGDNRDPFVGYYGNDRGE